MTTSYTNYASTLTKGGASIGNCLVIDFPEIKTNKIESTNHAGLGLREYIPDGLLGLEDITVSVIVASGVITALDTDVDAKTISAWAVKNSLNTMTFSGFVTSIKPEAADAQSPDIDKVTVVISPTGGIAFS